MAEAVQKADRQKARWSETFKALSTFVSTVVIAIAGIMVTNRYNDRQLEISRNTQLSALIPQLGDSSENVQRFTAISLSLYGADAVPALVATLDDSRRDVSFEAERALTLIGGDATPILLKTYNQAKTSSHLKAMCLYTLGDLHARQATSIAIDVIQNSSNNDELRENAAKALGFLKDTNSAQCLVSVLLENQNNVELSKEIILALGQIRDVRVTPELLGLVHNRNQDIRISVVWMLAEIGDKNVLGTLEDVMKSDSSVYVRFAARDAENWFKRYH
jgi:HEAT repeat protein